MNLPKNAQVGIFSKIKQVPPILVSAFAFVKRRYLVVSRIKILTRKQSEIKCRSEMHTDA